MRLQYITQKYSEDFGELDVILCGDLRQLPPVRTSVVYKRPKNGNRMFASQIKGHAMSYFSLVQVVRQKDLRFSAIVTKIRGGTALNAEELALIESRFGTAEEAARLAPDAVRLFYSNEAVNNYNVNLAKNDPGPREIQAQDELRG